ncbi:MAG: SDR family oxidoreductase [Actinomycetota bacterium]
MSDVDLTDVSGHVIMIAGAASGIGRQTALLLLKRGAIVAACDNNFEGLKELKSEVANENLHIYKIDLLSDESVYGTVKEIESTLGPLKGLLNSAGIVGKNGERVENIDVDDFDLVYRVNLRGALLLTIATIKGMAERGYGRILHLSSISGKEGAPLISAYAASKAGLIGLVKTVGKEYASTGVTVNALAPAMITGPMTARFDESQFNFLKSKIPMGRLGEMEEVAQMAAWILTPACSFTTGFAFDLSGGRATY